MARMLILITLLSFVCTNGWADEKPKAAAPQIYDSPEALFKAYRKASNERDWQTLWDCLTPSMQRHEVFECYFGSQMQIGNQKIQDIVKKHGLEEAKFEALLREQAKIHQIDLKQNGPVNHEFLVDVVNKAVIDKSGFYVAIGKTLSEEDNDKPKIGELNRLVLKDNRAIGHSTTVIHGSSKKVGEPEKKFEHIVPKLLEFHKTEKGWLIGGFPTGE